MATPFWQPGNLYLPGDLVQPITVPPSIPGQVVNGGFSTGNTDWDYEGGVLFATSGGYGGGNCCTIPGSQPNGTALNQTQLVVLVGASLTARCLIQQGASDVDHTRGWVEVRWYDSSNNVLRVDKGNVVNDGRGGAWHASTVTVTAPAGTAYARAGIGLFQNSNDNIWGDDLSVTGASSGIPEGLIFKAVQDAAGTSGSSEPLWPSILGVQVIDNEVIWEAVSTSRVVWEASSLLVSGSTEPDWPIQPGGQVPDGTLSWKAVSRRIEDEKCPNSKVVSIMAAKVFAADKDIVRFSATANPLDWSAEQDAGYLPTGLQQANSNDMAVLAPYRSNLAAFNASSFQAWQVDPDPAAMAILDQMDGVGSTWPRAAQSVGDDLFYLSQRGIRSIGISNAAENLQAGDIGQPIDSLVQTAMLRTIQANRVPIATYYPGLGQYWLSFAEYSESDGGISEGFESGSLLAGTWVRATDWAAAGTFSLKSPGIGVGGIAEASYQIADGTGGTLAFDWRVSSEAGFDYFWVLVNNVVVLQESGEMTGNYSDALPAGPVTIVWRYSKDGSVSQGADAAWIDNLNISGESVGDESSSEVFVRTLNVGKGKWSRYLFPFAIDSFAQLGNDLYVRHGNTISVVDPDVMSDMTATEVVEFGGTVQWSWLDFGQPGVTKMLEGFDIVSEGAPSVSIGYDQRNAAAFTPPYAVSADTLSGGIIPIPVAAPTMSVKVDFAAGQKWSLSSMILTFFDNDNGPG